MQKNGDQLIDIKGIFQVEKLRKGKFKFLYIPKTKTKFFKNSIFQLKMTIYEQNPQTPPAIYFLDIPYHLNIDQSNGRLRCPFLQDQWCPFMTFEMIFQQIRQLLSQPKQKYSSSIRIKRLYQQSRDAYENKVLQWTQSKQSLFNQRRNHLKQIRIRQDLEYDNLHKLKNRNQLLENFVYDDENQINSEQIKKSLETLKQINNKYKNQRQIKINSQQINKKRCQTEYIQYHIYSPKVIKQISVHYQNGRQNKDNNFFKSRNYQAQNQNQVRYTKAKQNIERKFETKDFKQKTKTKSLQEQISLMEHQIQKLKSKRLNLITSLQKSKSQENLFRLRQNPLCNNL